MAKLRLLPLLLALFNLQASIFLLPYATALPSELRSKASFLSEFIAQRKEIFPLSSDLDEREPSSTARERQATEFSGREPHVRPTRQPNLGNTVVIADFFRSSDGQTPLVTNLPITSSHIRDRNLLPITSQTRDENEEETKLIQATSSNYDSNYVNSSPAQLIYYNINQTLVSPKDSYAKNENSVSVSSEKNYVVPTPRKINIDSPNTQLLKFEPENKVHYVYFTSNNQAEIFNSSLAQSAKVEDSLKRDQLFTRTSFPNEQTNHVQQLLSAEKVLELLQKSGHTNYSQTSTMKPNSNSGHQNYGFSSEFQLVKDSTDEHTKPNREPRPRPSGFFGILMESLRNLPVVGNVLRAQVDPIYRPILNSLLPAGAQSRQSNDEFHEERHCFGKIGCFETTIDFYDPIIRPINLPPDTRDAINTHYTLYTRTQTNGVPLTRRTLARITDTSYNPTNPTKFIVHGFLDDQNSTWIKEMVRGLLYHGDYNVFTVDWSGGSRVIYHQAVTNIRVVALEVAALINSLKFKLGQDPAKVHVIGHSLGSHMAGHIGERVKGLGRITGLDPAEPFFQHMPASVRLDPSDASFVDVIHTDTDSIITLAWQFAGYGLEQPIGHVDFYPNGGRVQPGCSSLSRIALTALRDGTGIIEGLDAAEKEAVACNHIRASKLFTASLLGSCSFMAFPCESYDEFEKAKCFSCNTELGCSPLGIHADSWQPKGRENVKMFLSTSAGPDFCQYHYRLTVSLADERRQGGALRGRLKVTFITPAGELRDFHLTEKSPLNFRRGSSRTFLLRHGEDLSGSVDALVSWHFEPDVFNPLTFCVLFCTPELELSTITLTPLDTPSVADNSASKKEQDSTDIVMCHKQGQPVIKLDSEKTIKISAEPFCPELRRKHNKIEAENLRSGSLLFSGDVPIVD